MEQRLAEPVVHDLRIPPEDVPAIVVVLSGSAAVESHSSRGWCGSEYRRGSVALTPPGRESRIRWWRKGQERLTTAHVALDPVVLADAESFAPSERHGRRYTNALSLPDPIIAATVLSLASAAAQDLDDRLYVDSASHFLAAHLVRFHSRPAADEGDALKTRVLRALHDAVPHGTSLAMLAEECGISEARFAEVVRRTTGETPWRYHLRLRVREAQRLLRTSRLSVTEIAYRCGFSTPSHFAAAFRRTAGATPTQWRAAHRS
jgi:AraC family transcriptional regulator